MTSQEQLYTLAVQYWSVLSTPSSSPDTVKQADEWLRKFSKSMEAWFIYDQALLHGGENAAAPELPNEIVFHAARGLVEKIRFEMEQIEDSQQRMMLKTSVWGSLFRYRVVGGKVMRQLARAVVALAIQMEEGKQIVQQIIQNFNSNPEMVMVILELFCELGEEVMDTKLEYDATLVDAFRKGITVHTADVLQYLTQAWQALGMPALKKVYAAYGSWVRLRQADPMYVAQSPLVAQAFELLGNDEMQDDASLLLTSVFDSFDDAEAAGPLLSNFFPKVIGLQPMLHHAISTEDVVRAFLFSHKLLPLHVVFSEVRWLITLSSRRWTPHSAVQDLGRVVASVVNSVGIVIVDWLKMARDPHGQEVQFLTIALACTNFPEPDVASSMLTFWSHFTHALDTEREGPERDERVCDISSLLSLLICTDVILVESVVLFHRPLTTSFPVSLLCCGVPTVFDGTDGDLCVPGPVR